MIDIEPNPGDILVIFNCDKRCGYIETCADVARRGNSNSCTEISANPRLEVKYLGRKNIDEVIVEDFNIILFKQIIQIKRDILVDYKAHKIPDPIIKLDF